MSVSARLRTAIVTFACIGQATAGFQFLGSRRPPTVGTPDVVIHEQPRREAKLSDSMVKVQQTLIELEKVPTSCKKTASRDLLYSCQSFQEFRDGQRNGNSASADEVLESVQQLYGIRMTSCELSEANQLMPTVCFPLLDPEARGDRSPQLIRDCLEALHLEGTNQWTTYSSVKLSAQSHCQTMRAEADKDDLIHFHRILFGATADVSNEIRLQKEAMEAFTGRFQDMQDRMRDMYKDLRRDNEDVKVGVKAFSAELKSNMTDINEKTKKFVEFMDDASKWVVDYSSQVGSAIDLGNVRTDEASAQMSEKIQTFHQHLEQTFDYVQQRVLHDFHILAYNMTQSVQIANDQTNGLASRIAELSDGLGVPLDKVGSLNSEADGLVMKHQLMQDTAAEMLATLQATHELAGGFMKSFEAASAFISGGLQRVGIFGIYFMAVSAGTFFCMWRYVSRFWALPAAVVIGFYLSVVFAYVHSPIAFARTVLGNHPAFLTPLYWSVMVVMAVTIIGWEMAKRTYQYFFQSTLDSLRLPVDELEDMEQKV